MMHLTCLLRAYRVLRCKRNSCTEEMIFVCRTKIFVRSDRHCHVFHSSQVHVSLRKPKDSLKSVQPDIIMKVYQTFGVDFILTKLLLNLKSCSQCARSRAELS